MDIDIYTCHPSFTNMSLRVEFLHHLPYYHIMAPLLPLEKIAQGILPLASLLLSLLGRRFGGLKAL